MTNWYEINEEKLAEWWVEFNLWNWPEDFIFPKPVNWDSWPTYTSEKNAMSKYKKVRNYMKEIEHIIGKKKILKAWHIKKIGVKNWQFEIWWLVRKLNKIIQPHYIDVYNLFKWGKNTK